MMEGNHSWMSMLHPPSHQQPSSTVLSSTPNFSPSIHLLGSSSSSHPLNFSLLDNNNNQEFPQSWSQLLLGGLLGDEDHHRYGPGHFQPKKLENWAEDQILNLSSYPRELVPVVVADVKPEFSQNRNKNLYSHGSDEEFQGPNNKSPWSQQQVMPVSSPRSCVTSISSSNIFDFSNTYNSKTDNGKKHLPDQSSKCNSTATGGVCKKARVQPISSQPHLKVRKEKVSDRITTLHQLVSPFGKTDTASVLLEATGYIRFLQSQIEALSSPYLGTPSSNIRNQQSERQDKAKDLRSRGLCLVPVSCTQNVGSENGADYWAPTIGGGF